MASKPNLPLDIITNAFGNLANRASLLSETEVKQRESAQKAKETRLARKEKQQQLKVVQELEEKHAAEREAARLEELKEIEAKEEEERVFKEAEALRIVEEELAAAEHARLLQKEQEDERLQELETLRERALHESQERQRIEEEANNFKKTMESKFAEQQAQMLLMLEALERINKQKQEQPTEEDLKKQEQERAKIDEADRNAREEGQFSEDDVKQPEPPKPSVLPTSAQQPEELKSLPSNVDLVKQNAMRQAFILLNLSAGVVETASSALGDTLVKAEGFSDRIMVALKAGKFNDGLHALALQPGAMKVLGDPVNSLTSTFFSELLNTHIENKKKHEKEGAMGYKRRVQEQEEAANAEERKQEAIKPVQQVPFCAQHITTGTCVCQTCMFMMFAKFQQMQMPPQQQQYPQYVPQPPMQHNPYPYYPAQCPSPQQVPAELGQAQAEFLALQQQHARLLQEAQQREQAQQAQQAQQAAALAAQQAAHASAQEAEAQAIARRQAQELAQALEQQQATAQHELVLQQQAKAQHELFLQQQAKAQHELLLQQAQQMHGQAGPQQAEFPHINEVSSSSYRSRGRGSASENSDDENVFRSHERNAFSCGMRSDSLTRSRDREARRHRSRSRHYEPLVPKKLASPPISPKQIPVDPKVEECKHDDVPEIPIIDKQTGTSRPSFTSTPRQRPVIDHATLANFQNGLKTWSPILDQLPTVVEYLKPQKPTHMPPQIVFAN